VSSWQVSSYVFEGKDLAIWHEPDLGSFARLADLCEIHWCGTPDTVLPRLLLDGPSCPDYMIYGEDMEPAETMVELDGFVMETLRAMSANWGLAARFRAWLIEAVFHASPHLQHYEARWAEMARFKGLCRGTRD
jgi:hypothetical protein